MTPVYLAQCMNWKIKRRIFGLLDAGEFSVNNSGIPFTAIGSDHDIEQENRALKVIGGIKGIANS